MQLIHIEPQTSGEAGGITSSLRCETAAWRKPEEDKPSFALAACCLLSTAASTTWLPGLLTPEEMTLNRLNSNQARLLYSNMLCIGNTEIFTCQKINKLAPVLCNGTHIHCVYQYYPK